MTQALEQRYQEHKQKMKQLQEEMQATAKQFFSEATKELFDKYPKLERFSFTGYTPYFNDGDTCEYSAHTDHLATFEYDGNDRAEDRYLDSWGLTTTWDNVAKKSVPKETVEEWAVAAQDVFSLLQKFDDDFYLQSFGDHVEIIVSRNGVDTEEYGHD
jgi:hypothetical protein